MTAAWTNTNANRTAHAKKPPPLANHWAERAWPWKVPWSRALITGWCVSVWFSRPCGRVSWSKAVFSWITHRHSYFFGHSWWFGCFVLRCECVGYTQGVFLCSSVVFFFVRTLTHHHTLTLNPWHRRVFNSVWFWSWCNRRNCGNALVYLCDKPHVSTSLHVNKCVDRTDRTLSLSLAWRTGNWS